MGLNTIENASWYPKPPEGFFEEGEHPTLGQILAAGYFTTALQVTENIIGNGRGAGKTWFWARAVRYVKAHEPGLEEL